MTDETANPDNEPEDEPVDLAAQIINLRERIEALEDDVAQLLEERDAREAEEA